MFEANDGIRSTVIEATSCEQDQLIFQIRSCQRVATDCNRSIELCGRDVSRVA